MSCIHATHCKPWPSIHVSKSSLLPRMPFKLCCLPIHYNKLVRNPLKLNANVSLYSQCLHILKYQHCSPVCSFGGKGQPERDIEGSPWKSSEKALGSFKENSIEDVLRKQIEEQEYDDRVGGGGGGDSGGGDRGSEGKPPRRGGGDGGSGDGSEDDPGGEFLQVFLATSGLILLYLWVIINEDGRRLVLDSIIYFFFKRKSIRLQKSLEPLERQLDDIRAEEMSKEVEGWLEAAILETPTHYRTEEAVATQYSEEEAALTKKGYHDEGEDDNENENGEDDENEDEDVGVDVDVDVDVDMDVDVDENEEEEEEEEEDDDDEEENFLYDYDKDSSDDEAIVVTGKDSNNRAEDPYDRGNYPYDD